MTINNTQVIQCYYNDVMEIVYKKLCKEKRFETFKKSLNKNIMVGKNKTYIDINCDQMTAFDIAVFIDEIFDLYNIKGEWSVIEVNITYRFTYKLI